LLLASPIIAAGDPPGGDRPHIIISLRIHQYEMPRVLFDTVIGFARSENAVLSLFDHSISGLESCSLIMRELPTGVGTTVLLGRPRTKAGDDCCNGSREETST